MDIMLQALCEARKEKKEMEKKREFEDLYNASERGDIVALRAALASDQNVNI